VFNTASYDYSLTPNACFGSVGRVERLAAYCPPGGGEITFEDAGYDSSEVESFPEHTERVNIRYTPGKRTGPITCDFEIRQSYIGYAAPPSITFHVLPRATRIPDGIPTRHRSANGISRAVGCTWCGRSSGQCMGASSVFSNHLTAGFLLPSRCRGSSDPHPAAAVLHHHLRIGCCCKYLFRPDVEFGFNAFHLVADRESDRSTEARHDDDDESRRYTDMWRIGHRHGDCLESIQRCSTLTRLQALHR
jgi:hypothetical protein